mgnify:CR=1 FL=1
MIPGFRTFFIIISGVLPFSQRLDDRAQTTARLGFNDCTFGAQRPHNFGGTCRLFFSFLLSGDQQGRITVTEETEVVGESVIVDGPPVAFDKG